MFESAHPGAILSRLFRAKNAEAMKRQVQDEFSDAGIEISDESILNKLVELLTLYKMSPKKLANEWLVHSIKQPDTSLSLEALESWEQKELHRTLRSTQTGPHVYTKENIHSALHEDPLFASYSESGQPKRSGDGLGTPDRRATKYRVTKTGSTPAAFQSPSLFSKSFSVPPTPFSERTNAGEVCCQLGEFSEEEISWKGMGRIFPVAMAAGEQTQPRPKYMFQKLFDKIAVLNDQIEEKEDKYKDKYQLEDLEHIDMPRQESVSVVGRVCCDSEGKLNAQSILLEGSFHTSGGRCVQLDVSNMKEYSLFSGQIIGVNGINNSSNESKLVAMKIFTSLSEPPPPINPDVEGPMTVFIAAGPFTTTQNLFYEPLNSLLSLIEQEPPDILILLGPFIDSEHPSIKNCELDSTFEQLFNDLISKQVFAKLKGLPTTVIMVPSQRDVHHDYVYPQPAFSVTNKPENFFMAPDPGTLIVNGVVLGFTSTDVLPHIRSNEIVNLPSGSDRLSILAKHLLDQRHYYPLYPPNESINFDYQKAAENCSMPLTPHILILPSNLRTFTKNIDDVLCVNPGRLSKGQGGGTYARIKLTPTPRPQTHAQVTRI